MEAAIHDLLEGARAWRVWGRFAWHDMVARYRRSWVGPFWLVLSAAIFIAALGLVYSRLFRMDITHYVPFVAAGVLCWTFITAVASEGVATFVEAEIYIRQVRTSLFVYIFRVLWRNILVLLHQLVVVVVVLLIFNAYRVATVPYAIMGLLLLYLQGAWLITLLAILGTRFRDLPPIITNILQILFFVTPIIWEPSLLGEQRWIADINPLNSMIAIVREPLLGQVPGLYHYVLVLGLTAAGCAVAAIAYARARSRVIYWL